MKHYLAAACLCLSVTACDGARSVTTMEKNPAVYVASTRKTPQSFTHCLAPKVEAYPVFTGFMNDDLTAPVLTRQTPQGADIYQMMNQEVMTLVTVRRVTNGNKLALFVTPYHVGRTRVIGAFKQMIDSCR